MRTYNDNTVMKYDNQAKIFNVSEPGKYETHVPTEVLMYRYMEQNGNKIQWNLLSDDRVLVKEYLSFIKEVKRNGMNSTTKKRIRNSKTNR